MKKPGMLCTWFVGVVAFTIGLTASVPAEESRVGSGSSGCKACEPPCPDDYRCKPMPTCPWIVQCGGCNDYCPKSLPPCPAPVKCGWPNDYCARPLPCIAPVCCYPVWYSCGPCQVGCKPANAGGKTGP